MIDANNLKAHEALQTIRKLREEKGEAQNIVDNFGPSSSNQDNNNNNAKEISGSLAPSKRSSTMRLASRRASSIEGSISAGRSVGDNEGANLYNSMSQTRSKLNDSELSL